MNIFINQRANWTHFLLEKNSERKNIKFGIALEFSFIVQIYWHIAGIQVKHRNILIEVGTPFR